MNDSKKISPTQQFHQALLKTLQASGLVIDFSVSADELFVEWQRDYLSSLTQLQVILKDLEGFKRLRPQEKVRFYDIVLNYNHKC